MKCIDLDNKSVWRIIDGLIGDCIQLTSIKVVDVYGSLENAVNRPVKCIILNLLNELYIG